MGRQFVGNTNNVIWTNEYSFSYDNRGGLSVELKGHMGGDNATIDTIVSSLPANPPVEIVGNSYANSMFLGPIRLTGDDSGFVEISATYQGALVGDIVPNSNTTSDFVKISISGDGVQEPIISHPSFSEFPESEQHKLRLLVSGVGFPNAAFNSNGTGSQLWRYVYRDEESGQIKELDISNSTVAGASMTPREMADKIFNQPSYIVPSIRITRSWVANAPLSSSAYDSIGQIVSSIPGANLPGGRDALIVGFRQENLANGAYSIEADYLMSSKDGWDEKTYG